MAASTEEAGFWPRDQSSTGLHINFVGMIEEHDRIVLKSDIPAEGLKAGDVGTVVHLYRDGLAYEVEYTTLSGDMAAVVTVEAQQVRAVHKREITHARELQTA